MKKFKTAAMLMTFVLLTACEPISQNPLGTSAADESESILSTEEITMFHSQNMSLKSRKLKMQRRT